MKSLIFSVFLLSSFSMVAMEECKKQEEPDVPFTKLVVSFYLQHFLKDTIAVDDDVSVTFLDDNDKPTMVAMPVIHYPIITKAEDGTYVFYRQEKYFRRKSGSTKTKDNLIEYVALVVYARKNVLGKSGTNLNKNLSNTENDLFKQITKKVNEGKELQNKKSELLNRELDSSCFYNFPLDKWTKIVHSSETESAVRLETALPKESYLEMREEYLIKNGLAK